MARVTRSSSRLKTEEGLASTKPIAPSEEIVHLELKYGLKKSVAKQLQKDEKAKNLSVTNENQMKESLASVKLAVPTEEIIQLELKYGLRKSVVAKKQKDLEATGTPMTNESQPKETLASTQPLEPSPEIAQLEIKYGLKKFVVDTTPTLTTNENKSVALLKELNPVEVLNMRSLMSFFDGTEAEKFIEYCQNHMTQHRIQGAEVLTIDQADTPHWHEMRYGRITASRIYQASRCKTKNGSLVDSIMGRSSGWSFAMQRGTNLEDQVFKILERDMAKENKKIRKVGLVLDSKLPHFGASPDGISDEFVVEIKCPYTAKTHSEYIDVNLLQRKYFAQIQLQMHITGRKKALLGVADLNFERNKKVTKVWIDYDEEYITELINDAEEFWMEAVFPQLRRKHKFTI